MSDAILSLKNVSIYQENKVIISNINLEVKSGEFLYIIGKTGSGKSSFLKTLYAANCFQKLNAWLLRKNYHHHKYAILHLHAA